MKNQMEIEAVMTHDSGLFEYWAGWKWSQPKELRAYIHGQVITPRWADMYNSDDKVMLDNGAFAAWRDGVNLEEHDHTDQVITAAKKLSPSFIVLPDIVGGGDESLQRTKRSAAPIMRSVCSGDRDTDPVPLVAVQEGMRLWDATEFADLIGGGIFVGGADMAWKRYAVETIRAKSEDIYIHVGRIWKDGDLCWHSKRTNSFDNTTFGRGHEWTSRLNKARSMARYCRPVVACIA